MNGRAEGKAGQREHVVVTGDQTAGRSVFVDSVSDGDDGDDYHYYGDDDDDDDYGEEDDDDDDDDYDDYDDDDDGGRVAQRDQPAGSVANTGWSAPY